MGISQLTIEKTAKAYSSRRLKRIARASFEVIDGELVAETYDLGEVIPANAIVTDVWTEEEETLVGLTSVAFLAGSTAITGAIALSGFTGIDKHALNGSVDGVRVATRTTMKITTVGTGTAGKVHVFYEYMITDR